MTSTNTRLSVRLPGGEEIVDISSAFPLTWESALTHAPAWLQAAAETARLADGRDPAPLTIGEGSLKSGVAVMCAPDVAARTGTGLAVVVVSGPHQGSWTRLSDGEFVLGRGHQLLGLDEAVSRQHLRVRCRYGEVTVEDLNSANGSLLARRQLPPLSPQPWRVGEPLRLGGSLLRLVSLHDDGPSPASAPAAETLEFPADPPTRSLTAPRWVAALAPVPIAVLMSVLLHSYLYLAFMVMSPLVMLASFWDERRSARGGSKRATREVRKRRRALAHHLDGLLDVEHSYLHLAHPDPWAEIHSPSPPRAASLGIRLGIGEAPSRHRVTGLADGWRPHLADAPVTLTLVAGERIDVTCESPRLSAPISRILAARIATNLTGSGAHLFIVTSQPTQWGPWLSVHPLVTFVAPDDEAALDRLLPSGLRSGRMGVILLDRVNMSTHLSTLVADRAGDMIIGVESNVANAHHAVRVAEGHLRSHLDGAAFTVDAELPGWFDTMTRRAVERVSVHELSAGSIPASVTYADISATPDDVVLAWSRPPTLRVPIGLSAEGVEYFDLAACGPHALIAGTTGSGKSEFLLSYLRALFAANSPNAVSAILIDYKGGATFAALRHAPHVVGFVTDLDGTFAQRVLVSLQAEVRRRERVLAQLGENTFGPAAHAAGESRLFVVVDEFRVLAEEVPDFVPGLVRIAAVGRSLGIHVILATQRPGGVVTPDIRANVSARVCLRVREKTDSVDVIDSPKAASLSRSLPGRALVSMGEGEVREVQTAYVSGPRRDADLAVAHWHFPQRDEPREECLACQAPTPAGLKTDVELFVEQAADAARHLPAPRTPVREPLPEHLTAAPPQSHTTSWPQLANSHAELTTEEGDDSFAVVDLPHQQAQAIVGLPADGHVGFAGAPRSGRTSAALHFATAAMARTIPVLWLSESRPVGLGVDTAARWVDATDPVTVSEFLAALEMHRSGRWIIIVDGWEDLSASLSRINHGLGTENFLSLMGRATGAGVSLIVTGGRAVLASKLTSLLNTRIVLRHNDPSDYSLVGLRPAQVPPSMPPGRGLVLPHGHPVQFFAPQQAQEVSAA